MATKNPTDQLALFLGKKPTSVAETTTGAVEPSAQQKAIFEELLRGIGNLAVRARAGTGKTWTAVQAMKMIPSTKRVLYAAFNVPIKEAVLPKVQGRRNIDVKTLHGVGFMILRQHDPNVQVDQDKGIRLAREVVGAGAPQKLVTVVKKAASWLKGVAFDPANLADSVVEDAIDILVEADIDAEPFANMRDLARFALIAMQNAKTMIGVVDFDDQVWLPIVLGLRPKWGYDFVFIDEGQDTSEGQFRLCYSALKPNGRLAVIGDDRQAIYTWRGADAAMFEKIIQRLDAKVYPLTTTYRCAKSIVREANTLVPDLAAAPSAEEGEVFNITTADMRKLMKPGDFVISRSNAALVSECTAAIRAGIKSNIQGRDLGEALAAMIYKANADDVEELIEWVEAWQAKQIEKKQAKGHDPQPVIDKAACLIAFADGAKSVGEVLRNIQTMFSDTREESHVTFTSTHRAKGLERERVFVLRNTFLKPRPMRDTFGEETFGVPLEEENLYYVAVTRAKRELYLVT